MNDKEKWIDGYEGKYSITSNGEVFSHNYRNMGVKRKLATSINNSGYERVNINVDGIQSSYLVHRLVLEAFSPSDKGRPYVNHINGDKLNNSLFNLEWCTHVENINHAWDTGLYISKAGNKRKVVLKIKNGKVIDRYNGISEASKLNNIHVSNLCDVCNNGRQITAGGYKWKYEEDYINENR